MFFSPRLLMVFLRLFLDSSILYVAMLFSKYLCFKLSLSFTSFKSLAEEYEAKRPDKKLKLLDSADLFVEIR